MNIRSSKVPRAITVVMGCAMLGAVLGCAGPSEELVLEVTQTSNGFLLGPEDVLEVMVWRNKDLSKEVVVRPDGLISIPLIGDVQASGLTADQLGRRIEERLQVFMETPRVSVHVKEVNSYILYVVGEVRNPGKYRLKSYASVLQAIALAGGFTPFASKNEIQVVRNSQNDDGRLHEIHIPVRYDDLLSGDGELGNFVLRPGDIVVVP